MIDDAIGDDQCHTGTAVHALQNVEIPKYKHVILSGTSRNSYAFIVYQQKSDQMNRIIESSNHRIKIQPASSVHVTALGQITS